MGSAWTSWIGVVVAVSFAGPVRAAELTDWLAVRGLLDVRAVMTGDTVSWEQGRLGKARYGADQPGDSRLLGRFAEGSLILEPRFNWDVSGFVHLIAASDQRFAVDVAEAFVSYKPAPSGSFRLKGRAGAFFPPISLENTGLAWTSPYSITPSAINSWVGEELKTVGPELVMEWRNASSRFEAVGALYTGNDTAGTELTWRGWAVHDRKAGVLKRLELPQVRIIRPTSVPRINQAPYSEPGDEIDDRIGYYAGARLSDATTGSFEALYYDNRAKDTIIKKRQWAWRTKFTSIGARGIVGDDIEVLAQFMKGTTSILTFPGAPSMIKVGYESGYVLASHTWDRHRISGRIEYFKTDDKDQSLDNNNEDGTALLAAYVFRPMELQRLTLEVLHIHSKRPERTLSFGLPSTANETQIQASYRFFF